MTSTRRLISFASLLAVAVASACSSSNGGSSAGQCASFAGTYLGDYSCTDGTMETQSTTTVVQNGCTATATSGDGTPSTYTLTGNKAKRTVNEEGVTGSCEITLSGSQVSQRCDLMNGGESVTCTGSATRTSGGGGSGGASGTGGRSGGGSPGTATSRCPDGTSFPSSGLCDGQDDCTDGFDEVCSACENGTEVVHASWVCDAEADCSDASDEANCFECADGSGAVPGSWVCDGEPDCPDGSDETGC